MMATSSQAQLQRLLHNEGTLAFGQQALSVAAEGPAPVDEDDIHTCTGSQGPAGPCSAALTCEGLFWEIFQTLNKCARG